MKTIFILLLIGLCFTNSAVADSISCLHLSVAIIKAHRDSSIVDDQIKDIVKELGPVLSYSGFSFIKKSDFMLKPGEKKQIRLSSKRHMELEFIEYSNEKTRLSVSIIEKKQETFRTVLLLIDKGSAIIDGPPYEGGTLLLRIKAKFE